MSGGRVAVRGGSYTALADFPQAVFIPTTTLPIYYFFSPVQTKTRIISYMLQTGRRMGRLGFVAGWAGLS